MKTPPQCVHHWIISGPVGEPSVPGRCKKCGCEATRREYASLIAAAPDLLGALEELLHWVSEFRSDYSMGAPSELGDAQNKAYAAIAKAKVGS